MLRYSQLRKTYTAVLRRVLSREPTFANRLARHNIEQILSGSFTAPKLQLVALLLRDFVFASLISLNDMNDMRIIEARSLNIAGRELTHAVRKRRATVLKFLIKLSC